MSHPVTLSCDQALKPDHMFYLKLLLQSLWSPQIRKPKSTYTRPRRNKQKNQHHQNMQSDAQIILLHLLRLDLLPSTKTKLILSPTVQSRGEKIIQYSLTVFGFQQHSACCYRFLRTSGASERRGREEMCDDQLEEWRAVWIPRGLLWCLLASL